MANSNEQRGQQEQASRQSGAQGGQSGTGDTASAASESRPGIGSSQGQDKPAKEERPAPDRPSAGTPDIEREGGDEGAANRGNRNTDGSLVGDSTGAFKERP